MKKVLLISNIVLFLAVIGIYLLFFLKKDDKKQFNTGSTLKQNEILPIAYVNMDSLLLNYNLYKSMSEELLQEEEKSKANVNQRANALQAEMAEFQKKWENQAFLSMDRAKAEQSRLLKKQKELQELDNRLANQLVSKQQKMNERLKLSIDSTIKEYNKDKKFHVIFCNTNNDIILYADKAYNITNEILEKINAPK